MSSHTSQLTWIAGTNTTDRQMNRVSETQLTNVSQGMEIWKPWAGSGGTDRLLRLSCSIHVEGRRNSNVQRPSGINTVSVAPAKPIKFIHALTINTSNL